MMKTLSMKPILTLALMLTVTIVSLGQSRNENLGDKYFEEYSYDRAIRYFEAVKEKSTDVHRKLAMSYFNLNDFEQSEWYYTQVVNADDVMVEDYFNYSQVLAMRENYPESVRWMTRYHEQKSQDSRGQIVQANPMYYLDLVQKDNGYDIKNIQINSSDQEFGTNFYGEDIVFASTRSDVQTVVRKWNWNQLPFLDIYKATIDTATMELGEPEAHHRKFNKKYHEGPATFDEKGEIMVFTSNRYDGRSSNDVVTLELFEARKKNDGWSKPSPMPFNNREYSVGHGSLTADGNTLYFVSDMPGGAGGTDIYKVHRKDNGNWGEPIHMGNAINTEGNEMFPFFHQDSVLFFASNGHAGLGGLDMYFIDTRENGLNRSTNMNSPINSSRDDFAFILNEERTKGYFSSNRIGGMGDDDIYAFQREVPLKFNLLLRGKVIDEIGQVVPRVKVLLRDKSGNVIGEVMTGDKGDYLFEVKEDMDYDLVGEKEGHSKGLSQVATFEDKQDFIQDLMIRKPEDIDLSNRPSDILARDIIIDDETLVYRDFLADSPGLSLHSMVRNIMTGEPIKGSTIVIIDKITGEEQVLTSPETGDNTWYLDPKKYANGRFSIRVESVGHKPMEFDFDTPEDRMGQHSFMAKMIPILEPGERLEMDAAEVFKVGPIYFDLDKYAIRPDAQLELNKVVALMHKYPDMVIELSSHTDCRATKGYNNKLSNNRARATAKYIRERLEDGKRITGNGLGEMKLVNDCECEGEVISDCSEEEHQRNRRTEFTIVRM